MSEVRAPGFDGGVFKKRVDDYTRHIQLKEEQEPVKVFPEM